MVKQAVVNFNHSIRRLYEQARRLRLSTEQTQQRVVEDTERW